jgi:stress response protein YsnF
VQEVGTVRVRIEADDRDTTVRLERSEQHYEIERVPVNRPVDATRAPWIEGETLVVPLYVEVPVVVRRLVLVEELRLHKQTVRSHEDAPAVLRQERAVVERRHADGSWIAIDTAASIVDESLPDSPGAP